MLSALGKTDVETKGSREKDTKRKEREEEEKAEEPKRTRKSGKRGVEGSCSAGISEQRWQRAPSPQTMAAYED